ncbi:N-acetylmuramoyl-L-alanine amidase [Frateuria aurantia]
MRYPGAAWRRGLAIVLAVAGSTCVLPSWAAVAERDPSGQVLQIDDSVQSPNQDSRVRFLVLHYTAGDLPRSMQLLTSPQAQVSAHYLVPDHSAVEGGWRVFRLLPESQRAWHAGNSVWQGSAQLNAASIGIEIVNMGYPGAEAQWPLMQRHWATFPLRQMQAVGTLAREIVLRYQISPDRVIGHGDIAPGRKVDPGPAFPWEWLYRNYAVGAWPDAARVAWYRLHHPWQGNVAFLQQALADYGYPVPHNGQLDPATREVVAAFQMHFRPARYDGMPDVETVARLEALLEQYRGRVRPTAD